MSQSQRQNPALPAADGRVQELRASAHLMTLDTGTFCLVNGSPLPPEDVLAGVRVSSTDPANTNVSIATLRPDGWISGGGDSALIRVVTGPARILITIYQPAGTTEHAPKLRVLRLSDVAPATEAAPTTATASATASGRRPVMVLTERHDLIAHVQRMGDIGRSFGEWLGTPGSQTAIEGFSITAPDDLEPGDLTYQAVLGRGWMSPWSESGQFCGSRGMALPILGMKIKLSPAAGKRYDLRYEASFVDGTTFDALGSEDSCETPGLAALEAVRLQLTPKGAGKAAPNAAAAKPAKTAKSDKEPAPAALPAKAPAKLARKAKPSLR